MLLYDKHFNGHIYRGTQRSAGTDESKYHNFDVPSGDR